MRSQSRATARDPSPARWVDRAGTSPTPGESLVGTVESDPALLPPCVGSMRVEFSTLGGAAVLTTVGSTASARRFALEAAARPAEDGLELLKTAGPSLHR